MNTLLLIAVPVLLVGCPWLLRLGPVPGAISAVARPLRRMLGRTLPHVRGRLALTRRAAPLSERRMLIWQCIEGLTLGGSALAAVALLATAPLTAVGDELPGLLGLGTLAGVLSVAGLRYVRHAGIAGRRAPHLDRLGVVAVQRGPHPEDATLLPFTDSLVRATSRTSTLRVIDSDALTVLTALSHPAHGPLEAPHPCLHGTRIELLVTPLRCDKIDPERKRSSCAEEALVKLGLSPEQQWARLQSLQQIEQRWRGEFNTEVEVRYLEDRPASHLVMTDSTAWFRPWAADATQWTELESRTSSNGSLHGVLRDVFLSCWADAPQQPAYHAQPGSAFQRQPQATGETQLQLVEQA